MHHVPINLISDREAWPEIFDPAGPYVGNVHHLPATGVTMQLAALPEYTQQKRPGVAVRVDLPTGEVVIADTTLAMFLQAAEAFKARYGDPRVDKYDPQIEPDVYRHKKTGALWVQMGVSHAYGTDEAMVLLMAFGGMGPIVPGAIQFVHVAPAKLRDRFDKLSPAQVQDALRRIHLTRSMGQPL